MSAAKRRYKATRRRAWVWQLRERWDRTTGTRVTPEPPKVYTERGLEVPAISRGGRAG